MKEVKIYTDGACLGNPGPGGWGTIIIYKGIEKVLSDGEPYTTNQRMELTAAICALQALKESCRVELFSDSAYLVNAFNQGWLTKWEQNGWQTIKKRPVENQDLWRQLLTLCQKHVVSWIKVKGHADNEMNNRCDALALAAAKAIEKEQHR